MSSGMNTVRAHSEERSTMLPPSDVFTLRCLWQCTTSYTAYTGDF